jgi:hypothetical protein
MAGTSPSVRNDGFRVRYDNNGLSSTTWDWDENTNPSIDVDTVFRLRTLMSDTVASTKTAPYNAMGLEYNHNSGGWNAVSGTSPVQWAASGQYADADSITSAQITPISAFAGSFVNGAGNESDNSTVNRTLGNGNGHTVDEWALTLDSAQVSNDDTIQIRNDGYDITSSETIVTVTAVVDTSQTLTAISFAFADAYSNAGLTSPRSLTAIVQGFAPTFNNATISQAMGIPAISFPFADGYNNATLTSPRTMTAIVADFSLATNLGRVFEPVDGRGPGLFIAGQPGLYGATFLPRSTIGEEDIGSQSLTAIVFQIVFSPQSAQIDSPRTLTADTLDMSGTYDNATLSAVWTLTGVTANFSVKTNNATVTATRTLTAVTEPILIVANDAVLSTTRTLTAQVLARPPTMLDATLSWAYTLTADSFQIPFTPLDATLSATRTLIAEVGDFSGTYLNATLSGSQLLTALSSQFPFGFNAAQIDRTIPADTAAFGFGFNLATVGQGTYLSAISFAFVDTYNNATITSPRTITALSSGFTGTFENATLTSPRTFTADSFGFAWSFENATVSFSYTLTADSLDLTGTYSNAVLDSPRTITAISFAFQDTYNAATMGNPRSILVGDGYSDVSTQQLIRTSGNRVYVFATDCDSYPDCSTNGLDQTLRAYKANVAGTPASFARQDSGDEVAGVFSWSVAIDSSDIVHVVLAQRQSGGAADIEYVTFNTGTDQWGTPETIEADAVSTDIGQGDEHVSISLDSSGVPHVLYVRHDGTRNRARYTNRVGGSWGNTQDADSDISYGSNERAKHPTLIHLDDESVLVGYGVGTFNTANDMDIYTRRRTSGGTWDSSSESVQTNVHAGIDNGIRLIQTNGRIHLAFGGVKDGNGDMPANYRYSDDSGGSWSSNNPTDAGGHNVGIGPGANGGIRLWAHGPEDPVDDDDIYYNELDLSGSWGGWTVYASGDFDCSVSTRWQQYHYLNNGHLDVIYWDDNYANEIYFGVDIVDIGFLAETGDFSLGFNPATVGQGTYISAISFEFQDTYNNAALYWDQFVTALTTGFLITPNDTDIVTTRTLTALSLDLGFGTNNAGISTTRSLTAVSFGFADAYNNATITSPRTLTALAFQIPFTANDATVYQDQFVTATSTEFAFGFNLATVTSGELIIPALAFPFDDSYLNATLTSPRSLAAVVGDFSLGFNDAVLDSSYSLTADSLNLGFSTNNATLDATKTLSADTGDFSFGTNNATVSWQQFVAAETLDLGWAGNLAFVSAGATILTAISFVFTDAYLNATLDSPRTLTAEIGDFALGFNAANVIWEQFATPATLDLSLGFNAATLTSPRAFTAATLDLSPTLENATVAPEFTLTAQTGDFTLTYLNAALTSPRAFSAVTGAFTFTFNNATAGIVGAAKKITLSASNILKTTISATNNLKTTLTARNTLRTTIRLADLMSVLGAPPRQDVTVPRHDDRILEIVFDEYEDITGWTFEFAVRSSRNEDDATAVIFEKSIGDGITITETGDATTYPIVEVAMLDEDTASLEIDTFYWWSLKRTNAGGENTNVEGQLEATNSGVRQI